MARTLEEIEKSREERRTKHDAARAEQEALDLDAIDALEEQRGEPLRTMTANEYKPGAPVRIAFRCPTAAEYKRYAEKVGAAVAKNDANGRRVEQETLALCCLVYPAKDSPARKALLESLPGTLISLAIEAAKVAELRAEDEGK